MESHREIAHPAFGTADVWNFTGGVSLCHTWPCVDYLMNDGNRGYAVLAGGPDSAAGRDVARRVAERLSPTSG